MSLDPVPDVVDRFAASYFVLNSIGASRRADTLDALRRFERWLNSPIEHATHIDIRNYLIALLDDGLQASTVNWHLRMLTPFYGWCWQEHVITAERLMEIRTVRPPRGYKSQVPRPYSKKEIARLWLELDAKYPRLPEPRYKGGGQYDGRHPINRWRNGTSRFQAKIKRHIMRVQLEAMIELGLVCGLRKVEIYYLSIADAHWDNKYLVVYGKRVDQHDKVREVPYPDSTRKAMREWFRYRGYLGASHDSLWLSVTGPDPTAPMSEPRMRELLHSFGDWTWHRLRHTCATERLRAEMPIEDLQQFLGHSNIAQTLAYAQLLRDDVHKAAEKSDAAFQRAIRPAA